MSNQITLQQAARQLNVSEKSIRRYIKARRLSARLIKGVKGHEYRIKKEDLKKFIKPPRGKKSHKAKKLRLKKAASQKAKRVIKQKNTAGMTPIREIIEKNAEKIISPSQKSYDLVDYKLLYERLLAKYEQSLIMIGSLEAQLYSMSPKYNERIKTLEESKIEQEELIVKLYQIIRSYENEKSSF